MNEMLERVARAICVGDPDSMDGRFVTEETPEGFRISRDESDPIPRWSHEYNLLAARRAMAAMGFKIISP